MKKVDFFIVGQPKSGTTALATFLDQHPEICISVPKETGYMSIDHHKESDAFHGYKKFFHIRTKDQYARCFSQAAPQQLLGDASTNYLYSTAAAKEIYKHNPNAKIIMLLRNPVDMIYSLYNQYRNEAKEPAKSFSEALNLEKSRQSGQAIPKNIVTPSYLQYRARGMYTEQVQRYIKLFPKEQIYITTAEDFRNNNQRVYQDILRLVEVEEQSFLPSFESVHASKKPRLSILNKLAHTHLLKMAALKLLGQHRYTWLQKNVMAPLLLKKAPAAKLNQETRNELEKLYKKDVDSLSKLTDIPFRTIWYK